MFYEFKLSLNTEEVPKNISCMKGEGVVDHSRITRWFKKFRSGCKNLDDQARSGRSKTVDSEAVLQTIEANPVSNTRRGSDELGILQHSGIRHRLIPRQKHPELPNFSSCY